jgi:hypothetical protein
LHLVRREDHGGRAAIISWKAACAHGRKALAEVIFRREHKLLIPQNPVRIRVDSNYFQA